MLHYLLDSICDNRRSVAALVHAGTFAAMLNERDATSAALQSRVRMPASGGGEELTSRVTQKEVHF